MNRTRQFLGLVVVMALAVVSTALAQVTTADVVGRVVDSSGGTLPGATVTLSNPATGDVRTQVTSETGDYVFSLVPIGRYQMADTPSFAVPDGALGSATFGRITSTANNPPRQFQFAAKYLF